MKRIEKKLKSVRYEERLQKWKEYFKNLFGNSAEITDKPAKEAINGQLNIKLGQFTREKIDVIQEKKAEKLQASKYLLKFGRLGNLTT